MKKILNFLMVMLMVMGLGMASGMTAFQAEAAETAADAGMSASGIYDEANLLSEDEEASLWQNWRNTLRNTVQTLLL